MLQDSRLIYVILLICQTFDDVASQESFSCSGGKPMLPAHARCDGYPDCPGGEDEVNCVQQSGEGNQFRKNLQTLS